MTLLESTLRAVDNAIQTGRIGEPVALRMVVYVLTDADDIPHALARLLHRAAGLLKGRIANLYAAGSIQNEQTTVLARLDGGQSMLVTVGVHGEAKPLVEATVFGNHGVIEAGDQPAYVLAGDAETNWQLNEEEKQLAQLVRHAQQSRQAVAAQHEGQVSAASSDAASGHRFSIHRREQRQPLPPPYGVLLVSGDHTHQAGYAEAMAADSRCRLVGLCDTEQISPRRQALNARLAERLGLRILPNLNEAIQRPDVHVVSICAEPERRAPIIISAARAGKHLYLDKPLCASVRDAANIVQAVREAKVLGHMFSQVLWDPAARARAIVASGQLGELQSIHCDMCFAKGHTGGAILGHSRPESAVPERFELPEAKRELTNVGVYCVDFLLWLLRRQVNRVFAATENYFFAEHQSHDMEDFGQMLLELDGGITASVTAARAGWRSHPAGGINRIWLHGSRGVARVDAYRPRAEIWCDGEPWSPPARDPEDPLSMWAPLPDSPFRASPKLDWHTSKSPVWSDESTHFFDGLQQGRDTEMTVELAAAATEVLMAAYRSAAGRQVIEL